jgi:hypothetical protein
MSDDRDANHAPADPSEYLEEHEADWDPMAPETTEPDPASDQAAQEEERQLETGEENPT